MARSVSGVLAVDRAGEHLRARRLRHQVRLAGQVRLVHHAVALDDDAVHGADLVREHDELVADAHGVERDVLDAAV